MNDPDEMDLRQLNEDAWAILVDVCGAVDTGYQCPKCGLWSSVENVICWHCIHESNVNREKWFRRQWGAAWDRKKPRRDDK